MRQSPTYIVAESAKVGDHVRFHARGKFRTGTVLEVKGVRAKVSFYVEPSRWDSIGHREQWIRFSVPEVGDAKTNAVRRAKAALTRARKRVAERIAYAEKSVAYRTPAQYAVDVAKQEAHSQECAVKYGWAIHPSCLSTITPEKWLAQAEEFLQGERKACASWLAGLEAELAKAQAL